MTLPLVAPASNRRLSDRSKFGEVTPFFTPDRVSTLLQMREAGLPTRMSQKWTEMLNASSSVIKGPVIPWSIPAHYSDPESNPIEWVDADVKQMVDLACRWKLLGDPTGASGAADFLNAYAQTTFLSDYPDRVNDSRLTWCCRWPCFIEAAMLIRDNPTYYTPTLDTQLRNLTIQGRRLSVGNQEFRLVSNWAAWGIVLDISSAYFLKDRTRFDLAIARWREQMNVALKPMVGAAGTQAGVVIPNVPHHEVYRQENTQGNGTTGLHYSQFWINAMVQAAEWARFGGEWLYDYVTPNGSTLYGAWRNIGRWMCDPADYPFNTSGTPISLPRLQAFTDILHALWPDVLNTYSPDPGGDGFPDVMTAYTTTLDYIGFRGSILAYRLRPLYG